MGIDKNTKPSFLNIVIDNKPAYLKALAKQAKDDGQEEDKLSITNDNHTIETQEYYFDENENYIVYSGELVSKNGSTSFYFTLPLSDIILVDILQHSIKKLNKLKTAMEALK